MLLAHELQAAANSFRKMTEQASLHAAAFRELRMPIEHRLAK
jgi:hypothetical protein